MTIKKSKFRQKQEAQGIHRKTNLSPEMNAALDAVDAARIEVEKAQEQVQNDVVKEPSPVYKGTLAEVIAFYPAFDPDERGMAYGFALVAENTMLAKYVATVQKVGAKQTYADSNKWAPPEKAHRFVCRTCNKQVKLAELASTVAKREAKLKEDPTARTKSFKQCPPCEAQEKARGEANRRSF